MIKDLVGCCVTDTAIPLLNVTSKVLPKVIEYCKRIAEDKKDNLVELKKLDVEELFDIASAAHYLEINSLLDKTCQIVADMMEGKTVEEIRKTFSIKNDYTRAEELRFRRTNGWVFPQNVQHRE